MISDEEKLTELRNEIDSIDNAIHDLIMRRTSVVEGVCEIKKGSAVKIRPSREASILYRLCAQHKGYFPKRALCRIWRELIVSTLSLEGPFSVAVYDPGDVPGYWDLARDQYGTFTPMQRHSSARAVVEEVRELKATVGVLPFPSRDHDNPWWRFLVSDALETPKVIARLPFVPGANVHDKGLDALVICAVPQEETGRDRSLISKLRLAVSGICRFDSEDEAEPKQHRYQHQLNDQADDVCGRTQDGSVEGNVVQVHVQIG